MEESNGISYPIAADPSPTFNQLHTINIRPLHYGFIVEVGCQTFAVEKVEDLVSRLSAYLTTPNEVAFNWLHENKLP